MRTPLLQEEIMSIVISNDFGNRTPLRVLLTKKKENDDNNMINKYFILKEVSHALNYSHKSLNKNGIKYFENNKYILTRNIVRDFINKNYKKPFSGYNLLDPNTINPRGILVLNIDSLCKLIMYSRKPELTELKDWVCDNILSGSIKMNSEYDPILLYHRLKKDLYKIGYIAQEYKLLDFIFNKIFSLSYTFAVNSFSTIDKKIENPYELSYCISGITGLVHFKNTINMVLVLLQTGRSFEDISNFIIPIKNIK